MKLNINSFVSDYDKIPKLLVDCFSSILTDFFDKVEVVREVNRQGFRYFD